MWGDNAVSKFVSGGNLGEVEFNTFTWYEFAGWGNGVVEEGHA